MKNVNSLFLYIISIFWLILLWWFASAGDADRLILQVWSNPVIVWEPVDITIKVVDSSSDIVKDYYDKDIYMEIDWLNASDYTIPADGIYTFQKNDQWVKIFSKWLIIKKEWEYKIKAYEVLNEKILWEVSIKVTAYWSPDTAKITINSPTEWSTETETSIAVLWNSKFPNTPIKIYLDSKEVKSAITDPQWSFNLFLDWVSSWSHMIYIQAIDTDNNILWKSVDLKFIRWWFLWAWYKNIYFNPGKTINQWDKIKISIDTEISVSNAVLWLWDMGSFVMDRISPWKFEKSIKWNIAWTFPVSLQVTNNWSDLTDANIDIINVIAIKDDAITNVKVTRSSFDKVNLSRTTNCNASKYIVNYSKDSKDLSSSSTVNLKNITLNLSSNYDYYAQIIPMDANNNLICKPSAIVKITKDDNFHSSASGWVSTCVVQWIKISSMISNGQHYISWNKLDNVDRYIIYKSDSQTSSFDNMNFVWETSNSYFQIPFDTNSKIPIYSTYSVQAVCKDWSKSDTSMSGKIQVWVADNIIYMITIMLMMYLWYKLAKN